MKHKYNKVSNTIEADRHSGFTNSAMATAELIDNSIQAGLKTKEKKCEVDLMVIEEKISIANRQLNRISKIIVADNAIGMNENVLGKALAKGEGENVKEKGMGKFGFGLYMSSISQCRRTDIYSWQNKNYLRSWLDFEEILDPNNPREEVPVEKVNELPSNYKSLLSNKNSNNGTIVIWDRLDLCNWKTAEGLFVNTEREIGRMYRHFINSNKVKINFKHFKKVGENNYNLINHEVVRANDPLFLMKNTVCPKPWHNKAGFDEAPSEIIPVKYKGVTSNVTIRFAIAKKEFRGIEFDGGKKPWGFLALKNSGVSIVRENRELELNKSWEKGGATTGLTQQRWANAEIHFEEALDELFRVTNNKQHAKELYMRDVKMSAKESNMSVPQYLTFLKDSNYDEHARTVISEKIVDRLDNLYDTILGWGEGKRENINIDDSAEGRGSRASKKRKLKTKIDDDFKKADKLKKLNIMLKALISRGIPKEKAEKLAKIMVKREFQYIFSEEKIDNPTFFDIKKDEGIYHIIINKSHPAYLGFFNQVAKESIDKTPEQESSERAIKLMLEAWARLEDEAVTKKSEYSDHLQDIRLAWGQIARDFLKTE